MKKIMISMILVICMICSLSITAFAETPDVSPNLNKTTTDTENILMFTAGKTYQFKNHTSGVTYSSSKPSVVTVDKNGKIIAHMLGSCTITRTTKENSKTYPIIVNNSNNSIPAPNSNQLSTEGNILVFTAGKTYTFNNHSAGVTYSSSNPSIITVDKTGNITANKLGSCTITRSSNGTTITYPVIVNNEGVNNPNQTNQSVTYSSKDFRNPSIPNVSASATDFYAQDLGKYTLTKGSIINVDIDFDTNNTVMVLLKKEDIPVNSFDIYVNNGLFPLPMPNKEVMDIGIVDFETTYIMAISSDGIIDTTMKIDKSDTYNLYVVTYNNIDKLSGTITLPNKTTVNVNNHLKSE